MREIARNNGYVLLYDPHAVNRYRLAKAVKPTDGTCIMQDVLVSANFTPKMKSYFTAVQVNTALAKVHALKYVSKKFK